MECLTIDVLPGSKSFWEKMHAYSCIRSRASCCSLRFPLINPRQVKLLQAYPLRSPLLCWNFSGKSVDSIWSDILGHSFIFHLILVPLPTCIDGAMLAASDCANLNVMVLRVMPLPDKFLSTTVTFELPGLNSEVFPRMNTLVHLGGRSH